MEHRTDSLDRGGHWDRIYASATPAILPAPANVLRENAHLLPSGGVALDVACGLGGNALFLARMGFEVHAYDISSEAVQRLENSARWLRMDVQAEVRDIVANPPPATTFDVIVVSRFLARELVASLIAALKPGGLLFYQTFTREKRTPQGPSNPDYLLEPNELLRLFGDLRILAYRDEGRIGDAARGFRDQSMLIGQKPVATVAA